MSYNIKLKDENGKLFTLNEPLEEGGTQKLGGNTKTWFNVTYNYAWYYYMFLDKEKGIRWLYGKKAKDCIERLEKAIEPFKDVSPYKRDYWVPVSGNCVHPLKIFLEWCKKFPEGVFDGD